MSEIVGYFVRIETRVGTVDDFGCSKTRETESEAMSDLDTILSLLKAMGFYEHRASTFRDWSTQRHPSLDVIVELRLEAVWRYGETKKQEET